MKFSNRNYMKPTPKNMRKLGDAILGGGAMLTAFAIAKDIELLSYFSLGISVIGKFLTNYFSVD